MNAIDVDLESLIDPTNEQTDRFRNVHICGNAKIEGDLELVGDLSLDDVTLQDISAVGAVNLVPAAGEYNTQLGLPERYILTWFAGARGKPGVNADIVSATAAVQAVADPYFEVLGTNASSDDVTIGAEGGIVVQTDGADGDEIILVPHLDTSQGAWGIVNWGTDNEVQWECVIQTGADITNCIIWAGLKLTNTEVKATDDEQAFFRYENGVNSGAWEAVSSVGGTDSEDDTGVTVVASTVYHLVIKISATRIATFYINGVLVATSDALTDATDLIPYIGIAADGAAEAKDMTIFSQQISRAIS